MEWLGEGSKDNHPCRLGLDVHSIAQMVGCLILFVWILIHQFFFCVFFKRK
jgi:hypothetical protein